MRDTSPTLETMDPWTLIGFHGPFRHLRRLRMQDEQVTQEQQLPQTANDDLTQSPVHENKNSTSGKELAHSSVNSFTFDAAFPTITQPASAASSVKSNLSNGARQSKHSTGSKRSGPSSHSLRSQDEHHSPSNNHRAGNISRNYSGLFRIRNKSETSFGHKRSLEWPAPFPSVHFPSVSSAPMQISIPSQHNEVVDYLFSETLPACQAMRRYHSDTAIQLMRDTTQRETQMKLQHEQAKEALAEELQQTRHVVKDAKVFEDDDFLSVSPRTKPQPRAGKQRADYLSETSHLRKFDAKRFGQRVESNQKHVRVGLLITSYLDEVQETESSGHPSSSSSVDSGPANSQEKYCKHKGSYLPEKGADDDDDDDDDYYDEEEAARVDSLFGNWQFPCYPNCDCGDYRVF
jgi:hypothetical protein